MTCRIALCPLPLLLMSSITLGACNKVTYVNPKTVPTGNVVSETGHFFLFGLAGSKAINAHRACQGDVSKVQSRFSFGDIVLQGITLGLYTPRTYELTCGRKVSAQ